VILQTGCDDLGQRWNDKVRARRQVKESGGCGSRPGSSKREGRAPGFRSLPSYASRARDNRRGGANPRKSRTTAAFGLTHNEQAQGAAGGFIAGGSLLD
jgi:hypothetical protein